MIVDHLRRKLDARKRELERKKAQLSLTGLDPEEALELADLTVLAGLAESRHPARGPLSLLAQERTSLNPQSPELSQEAYQRSRPQNSIGPPQAQERRLH
jgi:hypothetical protein